MMEKYILSFIVPMYNVELYIEKCIRSLCNQDLEHEKYEIIVLDDCSKDNSVAIVKNLQREFPLIKLVNMPYNSKQGSVRNRGLIEAQGKYVWFIDADDFIEVNVLKNLLALMEKDNLDILHFDYQEIYENGEIKPYAIHYETIVYSGVDFFFDQNELWWKKCVEVWRRIHKRSFLLENKFKFAENVMYEDTDYSIEMFTVTSKVKHIDLSHYYYRCNSASATKSEVTTNRLKYWVLLSLRCDTLKKKIIKEQTDIRFIQIINDLIRYQLGSVYTSLRSFDKEKKQEYISLIKDVNISSLQKYLSIRKFLYLKYPKLLSQ